jgi:hypothetical protein
LREAAAPLDWLTSEFPTVYRWIKSEWKEWVKLPCDDGSKAAGGAATASGGLGGIWLDVVSNSGARAVAADKHKENFFIHDFDSVGDGTSSLPSQAADVMGKYKRRIARFIECLAEYEAKGETLLLVRKGGQDTPAEMASLVAVILERHPALRVHLLLLTSERAGSAAFGGGSGLEEGSAPTDRVSWVCMPRHAFFVHNGLFWVPSNDVTRWKDVLDVLMPALIPFSKLPRYNLASK